ncbi:MAG TPA: acetyl-CoA carboxylase biotin carboxyl carrier protein [Oscillatoriaceae cyanobacterium M33_DOE_052]|uniref:Biotin carboxyl carrier protein of acetyl-CoA carboxylase n=1 Tax=Planktothricoides sp. SpSt-374 TaxID=2282167 RepID=A0A7C3VRM0_9CYAN|nr:acetyl-CoA carboxylase biotin carboxyl carrier protein [Oscillatoriaceae cyanobacterium M33_DOE_052]
MQMDLNELRELLAAIDKTDISELILKSDDFELTVRKGTTIPEGSLSPLEARLRLGGGVASAGEPAAALAPTNAPDVVPLTSSRTEGSRTQGATEVATTSSSGTAPSSPPPGSEKWVEVKSPMVGTFYRAPAPDEPPFVNPGDRVRVGQTLCIIEAMKLMNEIEAEVSGQILEIKVQNGTSVEFDQVLITISPD